MAALWAMALLMTVATIEARTTTTAMAAVKAPLSNVNTCLFNLVIHMCLMSTVGCFIPFFSGGIYSPSGKGLGVVGAL